MKHSSLGPSATTRWMPCPGSVAACADYPRETNEFAAQGTAAHEMAEKCLRQDDDADKFLGEFIDVEGMTFEVDKEMVVGVQMYLDVVRLDAEEMNCVIHVEKRLDMSRVHKDIFGTADCILVKGKQLKVFDLKYGRGVVEAEGNTQALTYAVGAMLLFDNHKQLEEIEMIIVQPRVPNPVKRWTVTRAYMQTFAKELRAAALATEEADAPRVPGEKQCQWCQHKTNCPEVQAFAWEKAMIEFKDDGIEAPNVEEMGANSVAEIMAWMPFLQNYLKAVESKALHMLELGDKVDGFKLVEKVGRRAWMDGNDAREALLALGVSEDEMFHEPAMLSPSQMEKLLDKAGKAKMANLVEKKVSGAKMVPESNPAPAVGAGIASDFADD